MSVPASRSAECRRPSFFANGHLFNLSTCAASLGLLLASLPVVATAAPDKWATAIAQFAEADLDQAPAPGGVLFVGSSSIRLWKTLAEDFPRLPVINRGFGGS